MFILEYPYNKEYYQHHSFILLMRGFDWRENWLYTSHIYQAYNAYKDKLIDREHYEAFKAYMEFIKHSYKD